MFGPVGQLLAQPDPQTAEGHAPKTTKKYKKHEHREETNTLINTTTNLYFWAHIITAHNECVDLKKREERKRKEI